MTAHGNESGGEANILALIGQLHANSSRATILLERLDIIVLPRYNPDGAFYYQRYLPDNLDPNRDHITATHMQTRAIKSLLNHFQPHIAVDMHDFSAGRRWLDGRYAHSSDMLLAGAKAGFFCSQYRLVVANPEHRRISISTRASETLQKTL